MIKKRLIIGCIIIAVMGTSIFAYFYADFRKALQEKSAEGKQNEIETADQPLNNRKYFLAREEYFVTKDKLNKPISPYNVNFDVRTGGSESKKALRLIIAEMDETLKKAETISVSRPPKRISTGIRTLLGKHQLIPYFYRWYIETEDGKITHKWLMQFRQSPDLTYHTVMKLPEECISRSWMMVFFEEIGKEGKYVAFHLPISEYDWDNSVKDVIPGGHTSVIKEEYIVKKEDLNQAILPHNLFFYVATSGHARERSVQVTILQDKKYEYDDVGSIHADQLIPYSYHWCIKTDKGKIAYKVPVRFMRNRDGSYHTKVKLPLKDLKRSWLKIYFRDIGGAGEGSAFYLDMSEYDWSESSRRIVQ